MAARLSIDRSATALRPNAHRAAALDEIRPINDNSLEMQGSSNLLDANENLMRHENKFPTRSGAVAGGNHKINMVNLSPVATPFSGGPIVDRAPQIS